MAKPPVVLIHGMWSTPDTLSDLKQSFSDQGYDVHTPRLPYHYPRHELSESTLEHFGSASIDDYVDSLCRFVEGLDKPPILVGHSMGGLLAQLVAARLPCDKLILLSSAPPAGINGWTWSVVRTFGRNLFIFPLWKNVTRLTLDNVRYGIANSQSPQLQQDIMTDVTYESGLATTQIGMWFLFRSPATRVNYTNINCPVLIVGGTEDKITTFKVQQKISEKYGGLARLVPIDGCCHWTIGGSYFPRISNAISTWLNEFNVDKAA